jgi:hypothetical protein
VPVFKLSVTVPFAPALFTGLPLESAKVTVTLKPVPAVWLPMVDTNSWLGVPEATVVTAADVPV